ncbi:MAG TPA: S8 family serine peptidase [Solirubrobacteraceae bacterium]|nr:S8 family serine peptidase [Solirubrobacteraceae bacterium]
MIALVALAGPGVSAVHAAGDPMRGAQWALDAIHADSAPSGAAGAGALVAIIDSGVESAHPDLAGRVVPGPDFIDGGAPDDPTGHGTHIAGIVAAAAGNGVGIAGIAPQARIFAVRVLGPDDNGSAANVAAGINAAVDAGADVINLSLNWAQGSQELAPVTAAMQRAADAGRLLVVAAGNGGQGRCEEPVLPHRALCVGALSNNLKLAPFSSFGQNLSLVAPGDDITSTYRDGTYQSLSGTSQAAAVTSGVAAMLVGLGIRGEELMKRLISTARDIGAPGPDARSGAGMLDAERALDGATQNRMPAVLSVDSASRAAADTMSRRGLRVSCDAARAGVCKVKIRAGGSIIARGSATVDGTGAFDVLARPTAVGRRLLTSKRAMSGVVDASLSGVARVRRALAVSGS